MLDNIFHGVFDSAYTAVIAPSDFLLCISTALLTGLLLCRMVQWKSNVSESFAVTLALLPATVCMVIMMVNGNVGTGVAIAGAFSLVRFRSAAGTGREIAAIFIAMAAGLMIGMGYLVYGVLFVLIMGVFTMLYAALPVLSAKKSSRTRLLRITIPESLNYEEVFDAVLQSYTADYELKQVKTTNMGSMFKLTYEVTLPHNSHVKNMIDELRCLNGNLEISLCIPEQENTTL